MEALGQVGSETSDPASHVYKAIQALQMVINAGRPEARPTPAPSEKTSTAVYVIGRDFGGEHKVFIIDVPLAAADHEVNDHLIAAEARATEEGYEVLCSFDENEHAAKAVNRAACIPMTYESNSETNASVLISDAPK